MPNSQLEIRSIPRTLSQAAEATTKATTPTVSEFAKFAFEIILPVLPLLLKMFAGRIAENAKLVAVLRKVQKVVGKILAAVDGK